MNRMTTTLATIAMVFACTLSITIAASAQDRHPLDATYHNLTQPIPETILVTHPTLGTNGDVVFWNGRYVMFYRATRCYRNNVPDDCGAGATLRWGIRRAVSIDGGSTFHDEPSGWDAGFVIKPSGSSNAPSGCGGAAEPSVFVDAHGTLALVYEANPETAPGVDCEPNPQNSNNYVAIARSSDGGVSWNNFDKLVYEPTTANGANVGTPEIQLVPGEAKIAVSYHRNPGMAGPGNPLTRVVRLWSYADNIQTFNDAPPVETRTIQVLWSNGSPITTAYNGMKFSGGVGKTDVIHQATPGGSLFYMALEAWDGVPLCGHRDLTAMSTLLARATDIRGPYWVSGEKPIIVDSPARRVCNKDMPSWWYKPTDGTYNLLLHDDLEGDEGGGGAQAIRAYRLQPYPPTTPTTTLPPPPDCDDGNGCTDDVFDGTACRNAFSSRCLAPILGMLDEQCGDAIRDGQEECDDGNTANGDCCSATCRFEAVGAQCGAGCDSRICDGAGRCSP